MHLIDVSRPIIIQTIRGRNIPVLRRPTESSRMAKAFEKRFSREFAEARMRREASGTYNCFGLVFAWRRACVTEDSVNIVFEDDGYRRVENEGSVCEADLAVYRENGEAIHIGFVLRVDWIGDRIPMPYVLSKWGPGPEYMHAAARVPYPEAVIEYWTDRP